MANTIKFEPTHTHALEYEQTKNGTKNYSMVREYRRASSSKWKQKLGLTDNGEATEKKEGGRGARTQKKLRKRNDKYYLLKLSAFD